MRALPVLTLLAIGVWAALPPGSPTPTGLLPLETVDAQTANTIQDMRERAVESIASMVDYSYPFAHPRDIAAWLTTLDAKGKWPDSEINYASGCAAQRANWPAVNHWHRLHVMAAAWADTIPESAAKDVYKWGGNKQLLGAIQRGMEWWFQNDFTNYACLDSGNTPRCPCNTPGLWNTNWFSSVIYVPRLVSRVCSYLAARDSISLSVTQSCANPMLRAYSAFKLPYVNGLGPVTGANALDLAAIGIDAGLLTANTSLISDAYIHAHRELVLKHEAGQDGIRTDGSFAQHGGALLYTGNYGKDFVNAVVAIENTAIGTQWSANDDQRKVLDVLLDADRWMIIRNAQTGVLHWDLSVLNRFITFPVADGQATANIHLDLTQIGNIGTAWGMESVSSFASSLQAKTPHANAGNLIGNKMFWASDYMVHRGSNYVTSLKMYSTRTQTSECINHQNPFGFHLSDGTVYTYLLGNEYEDIAAAWDWTLIPGTTSYPDLSKLDCYTSAARGKESFVGGVSTGKFGVAAMKYRAPSNDQYMWQKAWFFLPEDIQVVMISQLNPGARAISVLDQRRRNGDVVVDNYVLGGGEQRVIGGSTLWHSSVGYSFTIAQENGLNLVIRTGQKAGNWSTIGISKQPPANVDLFAAFIEHQDSDLVYAIYPGVDRETFASKVARTNVRVLQNDATVSAVYHPPTNQIFAVFWAAGKLGPISLPGVEKGDQQLTIITNSSVAFIYDIEHDGINVADPSQQLGYVHITLESSPKVGSKSSTFELPKGGQRGSSIVQSTSQFIADDPGNGSGSSSPFLCGLLLLLCILWTLLL